MVLFNTVDRVANYLKSLVATRQHTLITKFRAFLLEKLLKVKLKYQVIEQICKGSSRPQSFEQKVRSVAEGGREQTSVAK